MPDPSAIAGTPLPAPELPDRTVTVRVVRERMGNNVAGQAVTLKVGADTRTRKTDEQGRAQFDGLAAGRRSAGHDRRRWRDADLAGICRSRQKGGVRVALIAGHRRRGGEREGRSGGGRENAGAAGRRRDRTRVAHHHRIPGRQPDGVLPARDRQQRADADRHRRPAADPVADRRRRRVDDAGLVAERQRAGRHADDHRAVPAGQDDRAGRLLAAASRREPSRCARRGRPRWRRSSSASRRSATCRCRRRSSPTSAR